MTYWSGIVAGGVLALLYGYLYMATVALTGRLLSAVMLLEEA